MYSLTCVSNLGTQMKRKMEGPVGVDIEKILEYIIIAGVELRQKKAPNLYPSPHTEVFHSQALNQAR